MNISIAAEPLFHLGSFPVTNSLVVSWFVVLGIVVLARLLSKPTAGVPQRFQNIAEAVLEQMLVFADMVTGNRAQSVRFFPVVATIFFLVLFSNWIGLIPGAGTIGLWQMHGGERVLIPFIRAPSADLNFTIALSVTSVIAAHIYGMRTIGSLSYWGKFFVPPWKSPYLIGSFVGILELISEFAKVISFSFRLFGNVFAGEVLLTVVGFIAPFAAPIPFFFLEIFVGIVQASVFAMLSLVFFKIATETHGEENHDAHDLGDSHDGHEKQVPQVVH